MGKKKVEGNCAICGTYGPLSFEHVPPRKAFNDYPVREILFADAVNVGPDDPLRGRIEQRGSGGYTLCGPCNNNMGAWYGGAFIDWCYQGMDILERAGGRPTLIYPHHIYPLRVLKQVVAMFCSVNPHALRRHVELVRFVLNKEARGLPPVYRFFVYYNMGQRMRRVGISVQGGNPAGLITLSEITYPPFGYVMTFNSPPPDACLCEITHFARRGYDEDLSVPLRLPVLPVHLVYPGDYRSKEQIMRDYAANALLEDQNATSFPGMTSTS